MTSPPSDLLDDPLLRNVPVREGFKVLDRCLLYSRLGQGGMGAVYRGRHLNLDIDVALKCPKPGIDRGTGEFVARFQREARIAARIRNDNLVGVFGIGWASGVHYLIMEYVDGENVRERVRRKGPIDPVGPPTGRVKVIRGGSWKDEPLVCRSSNRDTNESDDGSHDIGFRVAFSP